jgi:rubrerythrin
MTSDEKKRVTDGLKQAIQAEIDGYHFYMMAARSTTDDKGREVFESLAQDEKEHVRFLSLQYSAFMDKGAPDPTATLGRRAELQGTSPIFSEQFRERIADAHFEMSALSIGISLELSAVKFYKDQAAQSDDATVKKFYNDLADWESGHYQALLQQQESLKEDYWAGGGFSPF